MLKIQRLVSTAKVLLAGHETDWATKRAKEDTMLENRGVQDGCVDDTNTFIVVSRPHSIFTEPDSNEDSEPMDESWVDCPVSKGKCV